MRRDDAFIETVQLVADRAARDTAVSNEAPTDALRLVPVEPTEAMQNAGVDAATNLFEGWVDEGQVSTLYRAMLAAAPASPLPEGGGWQDISTAPKDGTWIQAWRDPPSFTGGRWEPLVYVRWDEEDALWVWPDEPYEVFTVRGRELADMKIADEEFFADTRFTHWMPLPAAPTGDA